MHSATVTTVVEAPAGRVFDFLSRIENLPRWATEFARVLRQDDGVTTVVNGLGEFEVSIVADAGTGVIDMYAGPHGTEPARFPTRVVPLPGDRTAYTFTMFQNPGMSDELFAAQHASLQRELENVRRLLA
jgi:hypothetical protein